MSDSDTELASLGYWCEFRLHVSGDFLKRVFKENYDEKQFVARMFAAKSPSLRRPQSKVLEEK